MQHKSNKNSLSIRLTESVVFLRTNDPTGRRRSFEETSTSMVRGLLILELPKPTRISSIEIELQGKATTSWPEGAGTRRIEVTEQHKVYSASTLFFNAENSPLSRRAASVGPGLAFWHDHDEQDDEDHHLSTNPHIVVSPHDEHDHEHDSHRSASIGTPVNSAVPGPLSRHVSMDSSPLSSEYHQEHSQFIPTPPYTPTPVERSASVSDQTPVYSPSQSSSNHSSFMLTSPRHEDSPAQTLEDLRRALRSELEGNNMNSLQLPLPPSSSASSIHSFHEHSLSRRGSTEDIPEDEGQSNTTSRMRSRTRSPNRGASTGAYTTSPTRSTTLEQHDETRGRRNGRFSLAAVSNVIFDAMKDRVRSSSPRMRMASTERWKPADGEDDERGRTLDKGKARASQSVVAHKERSTLGRVGEILGFDEEHKESGDGWKEFKKGIYTYPISFSVPTNVPPTMECDYGSMIWRLKAEVHRPGAFRTKLTATREVLLVACPGEEDTEETENIIVERQWDSQLQYLISISGRSFHIGGILPLHITIMPLTKAKIHRISVFLDERIDYLTQLKRVARTEPTRRITLLALKNPIKEKTKESEPILPLVSDDPDAFKNSPFYTMLNPGEDPSELASSLMGPGPWSFHHDLELPLSCSMVHFSCKNRKSNIMVNHVLKVVFRVERGDDEEVDSKTGKRKLFDIVVQTPVYVLSCRCNPDWMSLPRYSEVLDRSIAPGRQLECPCNAPHRIGRSSQGDDVTVRPDLDRVSSHRSSDSSTSTIEHQQQTPVNPLTMPSLRQTDSILSRSNQFERLISGQESELGEAPPAYESIVRAVDAV